MVRSTGASIVAIIALLLLAGCDGGEVTDGLERSTLIGPNGGTIRTADNRASVEVPAAAISSPQRFTTARITAPEPAAGLVAETAYRFGPEGWVFEAPVTITIRYQQANIPSDVAESSLQIARLQSGGWVPVGTSVVDQAATTVSAQIVGFSTFAIVGEVDG